MNKGMQRLADAGILEYYDWSMHNKEVATYKCGMMGAYYGVRKLTKAELAERKAQRLRQEEEKAAGISLGKNRP